MAIGNKDCRLLVIEPDARKRAAIGLELTARHFVVECAASRADAVAAMEADCVHIVVINARLTPDQPQTLDGWNFTHDIRRFDPTIAIILITLPTDGRLIAEALRPITGALTIFDIYTTPVAEVLAIDGGDEWSAIGDAAETVAVDIVRINWLLHIEDAAGLIKALCSRLRFSGAVQPTEARLLQELRELMRRLFSMWDRIEIRPINALASGYSRAGVLLVTVFREGERGTTYVVKLGEHSLIEQEIAAYNRYIAGRVNGHRVPAAIDRPKRTRAIGGVIYTFVGINGQVRDLAMLLRDSASPEPIVNAIHNLFDETLTLQHVNATRFLQAQKSLWDFYAPLYKLDWADLEVRANALLDAAGAIRLPRDPLRYRLRFNSTQPYVNPVLFARETDFATDYTETTIHGDLHLNNVLIDRHQDTWLIDFASTRRGPLAHDYATMETSLLLQYSRFTDPALMLSWASAMFRAPVFAAPDPMAIPSGVPELNKIYRAVREVRTLVLTERENRPSISERTYQSCLFLTLLHLMGARFLDGHQRFFMLTCASMLAEKMAAPAGVV